MLDLPRGMSAVLAIGLSHPNLFWKFPQKVARRLPQRVPTHLRFPPQYNIC